MSKPVADPSDTLVQLSVCFLCLTYLTLARLISFGLEIEKEKEILICVCGGGGGGGGGCVRECVRACGRAGSRGRDGINSVHCLAINIQVGFILVHKGLQRL